MNAREQRGIAIATTCKIQRYVAGYLVPSQSAPGAHYQVDPTQPRCNCKDFQERNEPCKHVFAGRYTIERERNPDGTVTQTETITVVEKKTYSQDWPKYNLAQTTEKNWFLKLLADLCHTIPRTEPKGGKKGGRPTVPLADTVFAACFKVYSGYSARRFTCDLQDAEQSGYIRKAIHFNSVLAVRDSEATTPILANLLTVSATPLKAIETEWAVDSTGFSGCRYIRWTDQKYGMPAKKLAWVKARTICGTRTNVIAVAEVLGQDTGDSPQFPGLVKAAARTFTIDEVSADKAYANGDNFDAVESVGGRLYAAFRNNTTGGVGGSFGKAYHLFCLNKDEYMEHYHRRSMIESTYSMVKRKFGDSVKSKSDLAMKNEVFAKFVCHNICCVISAIYERGIDPKFLGLPAVEIDCTKTEAVAQ